MSLVRVLNILAVCALIGAAVFVYRVKYEATWRAEEVARLERGIAREKAAIAVLNAELAHLTRPDRIQALAQKNLGLAPLDPRHRVAATDLPMRPGRVDLVGQTIASLGIADEPIASLPKDDPIARTIEAMGLALPTVGDRAARTVRSLGLGAAAGGARR